MKAIKKISLLALSAFMALMTSCQKEDIGADLSGAADQVTITLSADAAATRAVTASTAPTRYIVEAYSDANYTTAADIFGTVGSETNQTTITPVSGTATLNLTIDRTKDYYFLFWADVNGGDIYNTNTLKGITLKSGKNPVESWAGKAEILKGAAKPTLSVTLKRAVARIRLMENGKIPANSSLAMTFDQPTVFNVADGTVDTEAARTETIVNTGAIEGIVTDPVCLNSSKAIYVFATQVANAQTVLDQIAFTMSIGGNAEDPFTVTNVPLQANCATKITGHYTTMAEETFTVSVDDTWATPGNDKPIAAGPKVTTLEITNFTSGSVEEVSYDLKVDGEAGAVKVVCLVLKREASDVTKEAIANETYDSATKVGFITIQSTDFNTSINQVSSYDYHLYFYAVAVDAAGNIGEIESAMGHYFGE